MMKINVNRQQVCAICKHWYDPLHTHIRPIAIGIGKWEVDWLAKEFCDVHKQNKAGGGYCPKFEKRELN